MGFFSSSRAPKDRISSKELNGTSFHSGIYTKLSHTGDLSERLNRRELETFKGIVSGYADSDRLKGKSRHFDGVFADEVDQIVKQVQDHSDFGEKKAAHIEKHLREALKVRERHGLFD